ncbi:MarC family protein [Thalassospira sp. TSL5-1]|uniref:MarC family protein n=1 Tax=Thalassospira sp. TSL5-1 TaxID=1544451 RepID=UPI00093BC8D7|nr:MarC family protein [Thalassospira sp. TSL5-1]OKH87725.1 MarC family transcriptional regulator [Thalassospira sp. TSL5-1]
MPDISMLSELIAAFVTLFVIVDPVGLVPVFLVLTQDTSTAHRRRMAIRACITSFLILTAFALLGESLLGIFGIHMPAFRISGGTLLFLIALEMLFERRGKKRNERAEQVHQELEHEEEDENGNITTASTTNTTTTASPASLQNETLAAKADEDEPDDVSIFPMSIPFLAGPGSIATVMLLMGKYQDNIVMQTGVITVVALVMVCALMMFLLSGLVAKRLSPTVATVISRLLGMILAALAIQFIIDGIKQAFF